MQVFVKMYDLGIFMSSWGETDRFLDSVEQADTT